MVQYALYCWSYVCILRIVLYCAADGADQPSSQRTGRGRSAYAAAQQPTHQPISRAADRFVFQLWGRSADSASADQPISNRLIPPSSVDRLIGWYRNRRLIGWSADRLIGWSRNITPIWKYAVELYKFENLMEASNSKFRFLSCFFRFVIFSVNQGRICCFSHRGEKVSMGQFEGNWNWVCKHISCSE